MKYYVEIAYCEENKGIVLGCMTQTKSVLSLCQEMGLNCENVTIGIDGEQVPWDYKIDRSCRVELYPPLKITPIERRKRLMLTKQKRK